MKETKNDVKAKVALMVSLATATKKMYNDILDSFKENMDDGLFDLLNMVQDNEITSVDEIMVELESYTSEMEDGEPMDLPYIKVDHIGSIEAGVTYPDGSKLVGYLCESDCGTWQAGGMLYTKEGSPVDLCMAEIKKGDLAETAKLARDNKDVEIYAWAYVYNEDYSHKFIVKNDDILDALGENEEGGDDNE